MAAETAGADPLLVLEAESLRSASLGRVRAPCRCSRENPLPPRPHRPGLRPCPLARSPCPGLQGQRCDALSPPLLLSAPVTRLPSALVSSPSASLFKGTCGCLPCPPRRSDKHHALSGSDDGGSLWRPEPDTEVSAGMVPPVAEDGRSVPGCSPASGGGRQSSAPLGRQRHPSAPRHRLCDRVSSPLRVKTPVTAFRAHPAPAGPCPVNYSCRDLLPIKATFAGTCSQDLGVSFWGTQCSPQCSPFPGLCLSHLPSRRVRKHVQHLRRRARASLGGHYSAYQSGYYLGAGRVCGFPLSLIYQLETASIVFGTQTRAGGPGSGQGPVVTQTSLCAGTATSSVSGLR